MFPGLGMNAYPTSPNVFLKLYPDTLEMFGETCLFGKYINSDSPEELCEAIKYIQQMSFDEYKDWCIKAYEAVKDYT